MYSSCIIIPIYKNTPNELEILSLRQCLSILMRYDIFFITHRGVNTVIYDNVCSEYSVNIGYEYFDSVFFEGIEGYNMLCLNHAFYSKFLRYDYMLIYQLDAWVFRDELEEWCMKGYDYIGAPWPERVLIPVYNPDNILVGNGGFSLRKIQKFVEILKSRRNFYSIKQLSLFNNETSKRFIIKKLKLLLMVFGWHNKVNDVIKFSQPLPEDVFWSIIVHYSNFKLYLPDVTTAALFCLECDPYRYYSQTQKLPFGVHAFYKENNYSFWNKYIERIR